ncbi:MAG: 30S ribosomal protein S2 [Candidatus Omnitrophica bacterium]|nr:30S ribosomal protein S2 [Candidatus Omnitrophota bacterium]
MSPVTIKQLLEAGVHFGHQTRRWNPKMARYIFCERNGIYILNLEKTLLCLEDACEFLTNIAEDGKNVLFVGTKKQAQAIVETSAKKCGMPYVVNRWLGGMLTNFETVRKSINRMNEITQMEEDGSLKVLRKKEILRLLKERDKMSHILTGIKDMKKPPGAVFIVDIKKEEIALKEARKLRIPVIAIVDTIADPDMVDYPIPGNDDALRAITVICEAVASCVEAGVGAREKSRAKAQKSASHEETQDVSDTEGEQKGKRGRKKKEEHDPVAVTEADVPSTEQEIKAE